MGRATRGENVDDVLGLDREVRLLGRKRARDFPRIQRRGAFRKRVDPKHRSQAHCAKSHARAHQHLPAGKDRVFQGRRGGMLTNIFLSRTDWNAHGYWYWW